MTPQQIDLIVETFALVLKQKQEAGDLFYRRLFAIAPELRPLFKSDLQVQSRKLIETLAGAIEALRDTPALRKSLQDLGSRHRGYGVRPEHYPLVGEALISTLATALGETFTKAAREAWVALYREVAGAMSTSITNTPIMTMPAPERSTAPAIPRRPTA